MYCCNINIMTALAGDYWLCSASADCLCGAVLHLQDLKYEMDICFMWLLLSMVVAACCPAGSRVELLAGAASTFKAADSFGTITKALQCRFSVSPSTWIFKHVRGMVRKILAKMPAMQKYTGSQA